MYIYEGEYDVVFNDKDVRLDLYASIDSEGILNEVTKLKNKVVKK